MFFNIGVYFMPISTVLSALAANLTSDKTLIGAISLVWYVGWLAPQLFAARLVRGKPLMKRYALVPGLIFRPIILLLAAWLWWDRAASPELTVWLLLGGIALFMTSDGVTTSAWFDMQGRAFTPSVRSRVITISSLLASVCGLGAGLVVQRVLASPALAFPINYALLLLFAFICYMLSLGCMMLIRERASVVAAPVDANTRQPGFFKLVLTLVRDSATIQRLLLARLCTGVENMAAAFYVVFARERLLLPESSVGTFTIAVVAGGFIGVAGFGWLSSRLGARRVIQTAAVMQVLTPAIALLAAVIPLGAVASYVALVVVMALNGAVNRSMMLGYFSYAQDISAEIDRPLVIGAVSTVAGTASLMPILGGLLINVLTARGAVWLAYPLLFGAATLVAALGTLYAWRLPAPR